MKRDGQLCFFCLKPVGVDITVEHLIALVDSGPDHLSNKVLAHSVCNQKAGSLSVMEKIQVRESNLGELCR